MIRSKQFLTLVAATLAVTLLCGSPALAINGTATRLLDFDDINFDGMNGRLVNGTTSGSDAVFLLREGTAGQRYVKISDVAGAKTGSVFDGATFSDPDVTGNISGDMDVVGGTIGANDPTNDIVFSLDFASGTFTKLLSEADGDAYTVLINGSGTFNPTFGALDPTDGSYVVYDSTSDSFGRISGGSISNVFIDTEIAALISDDIATGISIRSDGNWIVGDADGGPPNAEAYYLIDPVAETSTLLANEADMIVAVETIGSAMTSS